MAGFIGFKKLRFGKILLKVARKTRVTIMVLKKKLELDGDGFGKGDVGSI